MEPEVSPPHARNSALLTIDMQRDFGLPSSPAHVPGTLDATARMRRIVEGFRRAHRPIVHMVRLYLSDGSNADLPVGPTWRPGTSWCARGPRVRSSWTN
jgi:nicotinamidase-related amidase